MTVTYDDFPKKGEYLTLVSLSTNPAQVGLPELQRDLQYFFNFLKILFTRLYFIKNDRFFEEKEMFVQLLYLLSIYKMFLLQVSHGSGPNLESSHNNAAHTALKSLAATGLDTIAAAGVDNLSKLENG